MCTSCIDPTSNGYYSIVMDIRDILGLQQGQDKPTETRGRTDKTRNEEKKPIFLKMEPFDVVFT